MTGELKEIEPHSTTLEATATVVQVDPHTEREKEVARRQKTFFRKMDEVIRLSHTNANDFDHNIRNRMYTLLSTSCAMAHINLITRINEESGKSYAIPLHISQQTRHSTITKALKKLDITIERQGPIPSPEEVTGVSQTHMTVQLTQNFKVGLEGLLDQRLEPSHPSAGIVNPGLDMIQREGGIRFGNYDSTKPLLQAYREGNRSMEALGKDPFLYSTSNYRISIPSQRTYLIAGIKEAGRVLLRSKEPTNKVKHRQLEGALSQLEASYNAIFDVPTIWPPEQGKKQAATAPPPPPPKKPHTIPTEDLPLVYEPFPILGGLRSLFDLSAENSWPKGNRRQDMEERNRRQKLAHATAQIGLFISPAKQEGSDQHHSLINKNSPPQAELGEALFGQQAETAKVIKYMAGLDRDTKSAVSEAQRTRNIAAFKHNFDLGSAKSPLKETALASQNSLIECIALSPIAIVAAIGTPDLVNQTRQHLGNMYPLKPTDNTETELPTSHDIEISKLAITACKNASITPPKPMAAAAQRLPGQLPDESGEINDLVKKVEGIIDDYRKRRPPDKTPKDNKKPLPVQFRCKQELGTGFPILVEIYDMNGRNCRRIRVRAEPPTMETALNLKQALQGHIMGNSALTGVWPYREMGMGPANLPDPEGIVPNVAPNAGSTTPTEISDLWQVPLRFNEGGREVPMTISLGLERGEPRERANERRDQLLHILDQARQNQETLTRAQLNQRMEQHYHNDWYESQTRDLVGVPSTIGNDEVEIDGERMGFKIPGSRIDISKMSRGRRPNCSWLVRITFSPQLCNNAWNEREILLCTENEQEADKKLIEFVKSYIKAENALANQHTSDSRWDLDNNPDGRKLKVITREDFEALKIKRQEYRETHSEHPNSLKTDFTDGDRWELARLKTPIFELGHAAILKNIAPLDNSGNCNFTISVMRGASHTPDTEQQTSPTTVADGVLEPVFQSIGRGEQRTNVLLEQTVSLPAHMHNRIPEFVNDVNVLFRRFVNDAFGRTTNPIYDPRKIVTEKAKQNYDTRDLVSALRRAIDTVHDRYMHTPPETNTGPTPPSHAPDGDGTKPKPGDPYFRVLPRDGNLDAFRKPLHQRSISQPKNWEI